MNAGAAQRLAAAWGRALVDTSFVSMSGAEIEELLEHLAARLLDAARSEPFDPSPAGQVGAALVQAHFTAAESLGRSVAVLGTELAPDVDRDRIAEVQSSFATGYAHAMWLRTLDEQERIGKAALIARSAAQDALRRSEARFRAVFSGAGIGIGIADVDGTIMEINHLMADMMGVPARSVPGSNLMSLLDADDARTYSTLARGGRDHVRFEKQYERPDGEALWLDLTISLIRDGTGQPRYTVTMARDMTQRYRLQHRLQHQATHDPLTQLPNRTLFFERLTALFAGAAESDARVGLCYLDLDGFKMVNDTLGHEAGDDLLVTVARRLDACVAPHDYLAARIGGDEFVILVPRSEGTEAVTRLADEVLTALRLPIQVAGHRLQISASIGIVECPVRQTSMADLMKAADVTLYWAKSDGKSRWALFEAERNARQVARYALSAAMPAALESGQFAIDYQPLVRLVDRVAVGVEALVRWHHPRLGLLAPDEFISLAEETGLIVDLGRWVLTEACRQARAWQVEHPDLVVSVNLAARQTRDPGLVDDVAGILDSTGLDPARLQLELTESAVMGTADQPLKALHQLSEMGVRIAIDDFGTGYSNLAYLRRLPVHGLKLAGSFVEGLRAGGADPVDEQIVAMLIGLAHTLELTVTAEGVETEVQAARLQALGCDMAQGWYFARPAPPELVAELLGAGS